MEKPTRLYKYESGSTHSLTNLSDSKIWFSDPRTFNDPFDCALPVDMPELTDADCVATLDALANRFGESDVARFRGHSAADLKTRIARGLRTALEDGLRTVGGVSCFSEKVDDILMWGHYANGHRGFCLEFETALDDTFELARPVRYTDRFPTVDIAEVIQFRFGSVFDLMCTKATCWAYEKEWRVLHKEMGTLFGYRPCSLIGVYFGAVMPDAEQRKIGNVLLNTETKLYKMSMAPNEFRLLATPAAFTAVGPP